MNEFPTKYLPVYGVDIYRSLSMLLQSDVSALDVIQGTSLAALKQFLQMLHELLPASEEYKEYLSNVSTWLNTKTSITGQEWSAFLKEINVRFDFIHYFVFSPNSCVNFCACLQ
ncbi:unnamed protein product [Trichobilharzia regenti]|nr:unnamed protein product [Trichobilharzia regenti]